MISGILDFVLAGFSFKFGGSSSRILVRDDSAAIPLVPFASWSLESYWNFKLRPSSTQFNSSIPIFTYVRASSDVSISLSASGTIEASISQCSGIASNAPRLSVASTFKIPESQWIHLAVTYSDQTRSLVLYLNGSRIGFQTLGAPPVGRESEYSRCSKVLEEGTLRIQFPVNVTGATAGARVTQVNKGTFPNSYFVPYGIQYFCFLTPHFKK